MESTTKAPISKTVTSKDGTTILFDKYGTGPAIILVDAAMADRSGSTALAGLLAPRFTVVNYDRRGRGKSTDTPPYAPEREIEYIEALIDAVGGPVCLFGYSSGAVLALDTAEKLRGKVRGVFMYEPPTIIDDSRPPLPADCVDHLNRPISSPQKAVSTHPYAHGVIPRSLLSLITRRAPHNNHASRTTTVRPLTIASTLVPPHDPLIHPRPNQRAIPLPSRANWANHHSNVM